MGKDKIKRTDREKEREMGEGDYRERRETRKGERVRE